MYGRYALLLLLGVVSAGISHAQVYSGFESPNDLGAVEGSPLLYIQKENGSVLAAPLLPNQVGFSNVKFSPDRRRVGWLALMPTAAASYPIPMKLVIFKGDKIERVIDEQECVFGWTFRNNGAEIAYDLDTLHFSSGKNATLRDVVSGKRLASYGLQRVDGEIPAAALKQAPPWVQEIPDIER